MMGKTIKINAFILLLLVLATPVCLADKKLSVSLEQATQRILKETKGKILSAKTVYHNNTRMHKIRVLTPSGRVKNHSIPVYDFNNQNNSNTRPSYYNYDSVPSNDSDDNYYNHDLRHNKKPTTKNQKKKRINRSKSQNNLGKFPTRHHTNPSTNTRNNTSKGDSKKK